MGDEPVLVEERWFQLLVSGQKVVEGRLKRGRYLALRASSRLRLAPVPATSSPPVSFEIISIKEYPTFRALLEAEGLARVLPGVASIEEGVNVYRQYYAAQDELQHGVLAIHLKKI